MNTRESTSRTSLPAAMLWLLLASVFWFFSFGPWDVSWAAWLAPLFLLRFTRSQKPLRGYLAAVVAVALVSAVTLQGMIPIPGAGYYVFVVIGTAVGMLAFLVDRLLASRMEGVLSTLVFPLAVTTLEFVGSFGDFGTWGSVAYTQTNLVLLQLLSVTGLWGLTFLVSWFASLANWAWERGFAWPRIRTGVAWYASVLALVICYGSLRLVLSAPGGETVPVAAVAGSETAGSVLTRASGEDGTMIHNAARRTQQEHLALSRKAAEAGARLIAWPEGAVLVSEDDEAVFVAQARALAREAGVFLGVAMIVLPPAFPEQPLENKLVWIDPAGEVRTEYLKAIPVPGEPIVRGDGVVPILDTPIGQVASAICFDMDHPRLIRQAGTAGADVLVAPSNDWSEIADVHARMAVFRAIENGFSLVRPTASGRSVVADALGRIWGRADHQATASYTLITHVPRGGTRTLYSVLGDTFAWLCVAGLFLVTGAGLLRRGRRARRRAKLLEVT